MIQMELMLPLRCWCVTTCARACTMAISSLSWLHARRRQSRRLTRGGLLLLLRSTVGATPRQQCPKALVKGVPHATKLPMPKSIRHQWERVWPCRCAGRGRDWGRSCRRLRKQTLRKGWVGMKSWRPMSVSINSKRRM